MFAPSDGVDGQDDASSPWKKRTSMALATDDKVSRVSCGEQRLQVSIQVESPAPGYETTLPVMPALI